jgi:hypothetical protein
VGAYMVEIWALSLFFKSFVGVAAPTEFSIAPPKAVVTPMFIYLDLEDI